MNSKHTTSDKLLDDLEEQIYEQWIFRKPLNIISLNTNKSIEDISKILSNINKKFDSFEKSIILLEKMGIVPIMSVPKKSKSKMETL